MPRDDVQRVLDAVFRQIKTVPGAAASASVSTSRVAHTRFARGDITQSGEDEDFGLEVEVSLGLRHAQATTNQLDPASVTEAVSKAVRLARLAPEDEEHMPPLGPQRYGRTPPLYDAALARFDAPARAALVAGCIEAAGGDVELAGFDTASAWSVTLGSSAGLHATGSGTDSELTLTARTADGTGSGWAGAWSARAGGFDAATLARAAVDKARRSQKPRKLDPGRYTVVLEPAAAGELLEFLVRSLAARAADEGRSFFSRPGGGSKLGEKLFADAVTLVSDPADAQLPGLPFDDEGLPRAPIAWIEAGTLKNLVTTRYWGKKTGRPPTARPHVFHLRGGSAASTDELVKGVKRGLLVTRFWYSRFLDRQTLLATGLTRDGTFLIEDGQVVAPVNNFRWNESAAAVLKNVEAMTKGSVRTPMSDVLRVPAMRVAEFNMASISEAV